MTETRDQFVVKYTDKRVDANGNVSGEGAYAQCVDIVNLYLKEVDGESEILWTNAVDFLSKAASTFQVITNTPSVFPLPGDIVVFKKYGTLYGANGHVAIVISADINSMTVFEQNYPVEGSVCKIGSHSYLGCVGWMHLITSTPINTEPGTGLPANYADIVHGSGQWDATVGAYLPTGTQPKDASFGDIQKVIAGYKSQATAQTNQVKQDQIDLASANQKVTNDEAKISSLNDQLTNLDSTWKARYDALNKTSGSVDAVTAHYEGIVAGLQTQFDDEQKAHHDDLVTLATTKTQLQQCQTGGATGTLPSTYSVGELIAAVFKKIIGRK